MKDAIIHLFYCSLRDFQRQKTGSTVKQFEILSQLVCLEFYETTRREQNHANSEHEVVRETDMVDAFVIYFKYLRPGGYCLIFSRLNSGRVRFIDSTEFIVSTSTAYISK